jgi:undecaprenyl-diphosphatase
MNGIENINLKLFLQINAGADTPLWLVNIATIIAEGVIYLIPLLLVFFWFWGNVTQRRFTLKLCALALFALGINQLVALVWPHPRPFVMGIGHTWLTHAPDSSFPSDHVTIFAVTSIVLLFENMRKLGFSILLLGLFVAWSRIYLGVHYPLDMIGSVAVSLVAYLIITPIWRVLGTIVTDFFERIYRGVFGWPISMGWILR